MKRTELGPGEKSLARGSTFAKERSELGPGEKSQARGSTFRPAAEREPRPQRRRPISPASPAQRAKVKRTGCIVTGAVEGVDPAHLWPRGLGGCDDPLCVVGLRRDVHQAFDEHRFELLPHLIAHGYWAEIAHLVEIHHVDPVALLERLTGLRCTLE